MRNQQLMEAAVRYRMGKIVNDVDIIDMLAYLHV